MFVVFCYPQNHHSRPWKVYRQQCRPTLWRISFGRWLSLWVQSGVGLYVHIEDLHFVLLSWLIHKLLTKQNLLWQHFCWTWNHAVWTRHSQDPFAARVTSPDDILSENGIGYQILQGTFCSKNHNIQVETNFGRASSMRQTNRGRSDRSHNMICKHLLAEIQHAHRRARARQTQPHHVISSANPDHAQQLHVDDVGLQSIDDDSCLF